MPWDEQEAAFQGSDREFLLWLYQEFSRLMFYTAQKYLADPHSQEEVVQESLKKLIEKVAVLRRLKRPALAGYVRATVRNTAIDLLKVQGRERERVVGLEDLTQGETPRTDSLDAGRRSSGCGRSGPSWTGRPGCCWSASTSWAMRMRSWAGCWAAGRTACA